MDSADLAQQRAPRSSRTNSACVRTYFLLGNVNGTVRSHSQAPPRGAPRRARMRIAPHSLSRVAPSSRTVRGTLCSRYSRVRAPCCCARRVVTPLSARSRTPWCRGPSRRASPSSTTRARRMCGSRSTWLGGRRIPEALLQHAVGSARAAERCDAAARRGGCRGGSLRRWCSTSRCYCSLAAAGAQIYDII